MEGSAKITKIERTIPPKMTTEMRGADLIVFRIN